MNPCSYRGYDYDEEMGYYYVASRYYSPEIGRFLSAEPNVYYGIFDYVCGIIGFNVYGYCVNNPIIYKDATGESVTVACVLIGAGVGLVVGSVWWAMVQEH